MEAVEASYWEPSDGRIKCKLCPRACVIADGKRGFCRGRGFVKKWMASMK